MHYLVAALLAVYFLFFLQRIVTTEFLTKLNSLDIADWIAVAFLPFLAVGIWYVTRLRKARALTPGETALLITIALTLTLIIYALKFYDQSTFNVLLVGYLATVGWIYTNYNNTMHQHKAHTMNVLIQMRNSAEFQRHRLNLFASYPIGTKVKTEDITKLKAQRADKTSYDIASNKIPAMDSALYVLNYYEFISVGVLAGDLDESMIKETLGAIFVNFHDHVRPIIDDARKDDMGKENLDIYENYLALVRRFKSA
jgi:hypothetical protein